MRVEKRGGFCYDWEKEEETTMIYVIAKLEKSARARLSWIQSFAASFGIVPRPIYGHITLAELGSREEIAPCRDALAEQEAFTVDFRTVEVLREEKAVAALADREGALEQLHSRLTDAADWTPCTVLLRDDVMDLNWVRMAMKEMFQPFTARVERIEFMEDGEIIDGMDLKGESA